MVITYNQGKAITGQALGVRLMAKEDPSCLTAQIFGCTLDTDGTSYRYGQRPAVMAIVLAEEDVHRFVEYLDVAICVLAGAFALVVEYACGDVIVAVTGGFEYEDMFRYLKTGMAGITADECDLLENYVICWDIRGNMWL